MTTLLLFKKYVNKNCNIQIEKQQDGSMELNNALSG